MSIEADSIKGKSSAFLEYRTSTPLFLLLIVKYAASLERLESGKQSC